MRAAKQLWRTHPFDGPRCNVQITLCQLCFTFCLGLDQLLAATRAKSCDAQSVFAIPHREVTGARLGPIQQRRAPWRVQTF